MKLMFVLNGINGAGGLERIISLKTDALIEIYSYEIYILSLNENEGQRFFKFNKKINFLYHNCGNNFFSFVKVLRKEYNKINPNIVTVCDDGLKGFFVPKILKKKGVFIYERHASIRLNKKEGLFSIFNWFVSALMKVLAKDFDKFVVLTSNNKQEWNNKNVIVIPNFLTVNNGTTSTLNNKKIIVVASHSYNKGFDLLLQIWSKINVDGWELSVYGKSTPDFKYESDSKRMGLKNIYFLGTNDNMELVYEESSILIMPSRTEGFGLVLIEAMSFGIPCVSFDCPSGPSDIIDDGVNGFLIPNYNIDFFVLKLMELIQNKDLRIIMGNRAIIKSIKDSKDEIIKKWDLLYKEVCRIKKN